jgi:hypothetical protein
MAPERGAGFKVRCWLAMSGGIHKTASATEG